MDISFKTGEELFQFLLIAVLFLFAAVLLVVVLNIFSLLKKLNIGEKLQEKEEVESPSIWSKLTNAVPLGKEETVMLNHNYDGIRELDNHLPPWWLGLFYGTVIFGIVYLLNYHVWHWSPSQSEEYEIAMAEGKKEVEAYQAKLGDSIDEKSVKLLADVSTLENGKSIYDLNCVACHGASGEGGVGPNLTDEYWLHGGSINEIFGVIKNGVPEKGMISWKATLKPAQIQEVSNYIYSLIGTNPANPKAPQGNKVEASTTVAADSTQASINHKILPLASLK
jgi:cytochrome c oxidase cbb3-type subunit III